MSIGAIHIDGENQKEGEECNEYNSDMGFNA